MDYHIVVCNNENIEWTNTLTNITCIYGIDEIETYLSYIIDNYEYLPSYLILLKGNPFESNKYIQQENFIEKVEELLSRFVGKTIGDAIPFFNKPTLECHYPTPEIRVPEYYYKFFDGDIPKQFEYNNQNQYILSRNSIQNRKKDFYVKIKEIMKDKSNIMKRLFPYMFDMNIVMNDF